ncbi:DUF5777 family beta-barrel protein [Rapidithrix thailandica]|uniref:DUF5777 family beta-barrel protein n=1 Tax=Rapidithrix thailandica TaxID=413964 RepID=A0AAW9SD38_9BACT
MKQLICLVGAVLLSVPLWGQDDLLSELEEKQEATPTLVTATFKGIRLINGHSVETRKKKNLDFLISHRFGTLNSGSYQLFGLDDAMVRFGLEYGITDRLFIGVGRSSFEKTYDAFVKYRLLWQSTGPNPVPLSVTWFSSVAVRTLREPDVDLTFSNKLANTHQLLIARKFSSNFSLQIMPTWVHYNLIRSEDRHNDVFALGMGGRYKVAKRVAISAEYYWQLQTRNEDTYDALAIGVDIETGGHVFQLQFTNATAMIPKGFIGETRNDFFGGDIHFGFNISRTFQLGGKKEEKW